MHILFLSDNFPPEVNAPASRTFEHCREWVKVGHQVTVITCFPNFPRGEVFQGYRNQLFKMEIIEGMRVIRTLSYIAANEGFLKRVFDYMSYMISAILISPFAKKPDLVIGTSPQFFTVCAAFIISLLKGVPFIFELRDLWPESIRAVRAMSQPILMSLLERLEMFLYRKATCIIPVTESFKQNLVSRGIDGRKIRVVTNGADLSRFQPKPKDPQLEINYGLQGRFVIGYIGTHGMAHGLETILRTAQRISLAEDGRLFRFVLLGNGASKRKLVELSCSMGLDNVVFIDAVGKSQVIHYWSLLDASVIHLRRSHLFASVIPSKLFECMAMGVPILHGVDGESARIVESEKVGIVFSPENEDSLCRALVRLSQDKVLYKELKKNCVKAARKYDRRVLASHMLSILEEVRSKTRRTGAMPE